MHAVLFVLGGTLAGLIWLLWERALPLLWNEVLAHSAFAARVNGLALGGVAGGLAFYSLSLFGSTFLRVTHATAWLYIPPLLALVVGGIAGFFLPFRPVEKTWREPHPFSRYDAIMTASFVLCVLLSYTTLTNLGDYLSMALGLPHAFEGSSTVIPVQFSRIAYYSQPIVLIGLPAALAIGGLTRAAYRWALTVPHRRLGAIGIGLTLLAFTLQLIGPMSVLVS
ncbi:MAG TPA: hypothetical protein VFU63_02375 [Ktedonobacterales bacterium]|nr:hypothetical protein [Ktedonobacterales bacterium]